MKQIFVLLLFFTPICQAQTSFYTGIYKLSPVKDVKVVLKPWDTIRDNFTFVPDSFKYSYAVMRPNGRVAVSVDYDEYGLWHVINDTALTEPDKGSGKPITFRRVYVTLDDGRINGYFEPRSAADSIADDGVHSSEHVFVRNGKVFYYFGKTLTPLQRL